MSDLNIPIVGTPLAVDSFKKNGMLGFVTSVMRGDSIEDAFREIEQSEAALDTTGFVVGEWFKWKLYGTVKKNSVCNILGVDIDL